MKNILYLNVIALMLTYASLLYQENMFIERIVVDRLEKVEVLAAGFPFAFLIDGESSPLGHLAIDPLSLIIGTDQFIFLYFALDYVCCFGLLVVMHMILKKYKWISVF